VKREELIEKGKAIRISVSRSQSPEDLLAAMMRTTQFLSDYARQGSSFSVSARLALKEFWKASITDEYANDPECVPQIRLAQTQTDAALRAFIEYVSDGLHLGLTPEREAELGVMTDYLDLAEDFLNKSSSNPLAKGYRVSAAVLVGATLEEFLRTKFFAAGLTLDDPKKGGMEKYAEGLHGLNLLSDLDRKEITRCAEPRNKAAHGEFDDIPSKERLLRILDDVRAFVRDHT